MKQNTSKLDTGLLIAAGLILLFTLNLFLNL